MHYKTLDSTMSTDTLPRPPKLPSDEAEAYIEILQDMAAKQLGVTGDEWYDFWPYVSHVNPGIVHHSSHGEIDSPDALAKKVEADRIAGHPAICVVESINIYWTGELGSLLSLDPQFFVDHMRVLDSGERERSLIESRFPNAAGGMKSHRGSSWTTLRGSVDLGNISKGMEDTVLSDAWKRGVEQSLGGRYFCHTNVSIYAVSQHFRKYLLANEPGWAVALTVTLF